MPQTPPTRHRGRPLTVDTPLDQRELAFVAEYLIDFKATRAALAVGYSGVGVGQMAHKIISRPHVQEAIRLAMLERNARAGVTAERVLRDIDTAATLDPAFIFEDSGSLRVRRISDIPAELRRCITSIKVSKKNLTAGDGVTDEILEVKFIDKAKMLELLAKHTGLTREDQQQAAADVPAFALPKETPGVSVH